MVLVQLAGVPRAASQTAWQVHACCQIVAAHARAHLVNATWPHVLPPCLQDCWRGYIQTAIDSGPSCLDLRCPDPGECREEPGKQPGSAVGGGQWRWQWRKNAQLLGICWGGRFG